MPKKAFITGVNGQDGSYLSLFLLDKGYEVIGMVRRSSTDNTERLVDIKIHPNFTLVEGDLSDPSSLNSILKKYQPDEIYNFAAQSHVGTSFEQPALTFQVNAVGVLNLLEAMRAYCPESKMFQASTSEMFGNNFSQDGNMKWQDEETALSPRSPYAVSKVAAHNLVFTYRESFNLHCSSGISFNHESEKRGINFVTRKVTNYVASLVTRRWKEFGHSNWVTMSLEPDDVEQLGLGNFEARRDWGHAEDYIKAYWLMLQEDKPDDYVISTGKTHSIRDLLDVAFGYVGISNWYEYVYQDPRFYRPAEVDYLCGRSNKAKEKLGWEPTVTFKELIHRMVDHDIQSKEKASPSFST